MKRVTFDKMIEILRKGDAEKHLHRRRTPKLSMEDLLPATLEYLREYRTYAHKAASYGIAESNIYRGIKWVGSRFPAGTSEWSRMWKRGSSPACARVHHSETRFPAEQTRPRRTAGVADQLLFKNSSMNSAAYFTAASQMVPLISAVASFGLRM